MVNAALEALSHAGEAALPVLRDAALHGAQQTRWAAVNAIGELGGPDAVKTLDRDPRRPATASRRCRPRRRSRTSGAPRRARLLIELGDVGPRADHRRARAAPADAGRRRRPGAPRGGPAGHERRPPRRAAAPAQARQRGRARARDQSSRARARAPRRRTRCACSPTPARRRRSTRWSTSPARRAARRRVQALDMLAQSHPSDPAVGQLLADSLFSGRRDEQNYAAQRARAHRHRGRAPGADHGAVRQGQAARGRGGRRAVAGRHDRQREGGAAVGGAVEPRRSSSR